MKFSSSIICIIMVVSSIVVSASSPLKELKLKFTDKNGVALENALVTIYPAKNPNDADYKYLVTDANGEVRVSNQKNGNCTILIEIPELDKTSKDKMTYNFTADNTKKLITLKSKLVHKNSAFFEAETRTDIFLYNSMDGIVRNMKIQLLPTFLVPQPSSPRDTISPFAYTNGDGRATFTSLRAGGEYQVEYSWLGGKADGGKIKIGTDGITTFSLVFDETLLVKK